MNKKRDSLILIANLFVSIVAFSFLVGLSAGSVSADTLPWCNDCPITQSLNDFLKSEMGQDMMGSDGLEGNKWAKSEEGQRYLRNNNINNPAIINTANKNAETQTTEKAEYNYNSDTGTFKLTDPLSIDTQTPIPSKSDPPKEKTSTESGGSITTNGGGSTSSEGGGDQTPEPESNEGKGAGEFLKNLIQPSQGISGLAKGAGFGAAVFMLVNQVASWLNVDDATKKAISYGSAAATFTYYAINAFAKPGTGLAKAAPFIGIGVGILVFVLMYKKTEYKIVTFECLPWQAPVGGENCEKCNDDLHICSEYRCKSLGQACEIVNSGTDKEMCVWKNPKDVNSPMITPWQNVLTNGYSYTKTISRPPSWGTSIIKKGGKCIPAFSPVTFGIITDKPAQCKVDYNRNTNYSEMQYSFGGTDMFLYNHTQTISIPGNSTIKSFTESTNETIEDEETLKILNGGEYNLFVRCMSANGYWNADPYVIKLCVDPNPDVSPPMIMETSIANNQPVQAGVDKVPIIVYTNEPAECKWSFDNLNYKDMQYTMSCANSLGDMQSNTYYACSTELTEIKDKSSNIYYIKCKDLPWETDERNRHEMKEPYRLILQGTEPLIIINSSISPNNVTIEGSTTTVNLTLSLDTDRGYKDGESQCYYSINDESNYIAFFDDQNFSNYHHEQRQDLTGGVYTYFFKCIDLGGNTATAKSKFTVFVDKSPPNIIRVMHDEGKLKIITDEEATCYYSTSESTKCNYQLNEEAVQMESSENLREHLAPWGEKQIYYIKCKDTNNAEPYPTDCSIIAKAENLYVE